MKDAVSILHKKRKEVPREVQVYLFERTDRMTWGEK